MSEADDLTVNNGEQMGGTYYPSDDTQPEISPLQNRDTIQKDAEEWYSNAVDEAGSIDSIQIDQMEVNGTTYTRKVSLEGQLLAQHLLKAKLLEKKEEFSEWIQNNP